MAITITDAFKKEVLRHVRVENVAEEADILLNINVAINIIWEGFMLNKIADLPASVDDLHVNVQLAIKHLVAEHYTQPDSKITTKEKVVNPRLIQQILGSQRSY